MATNSTEESRREYQRTWRAKHPEFSREYGRRWRRENAEHLKEYRREHREEERERERKFRKEHPDYYKKYVQYWRIVRHKKCVWEGCKNNDRPIYARNFCGVCYNRLLRTGRMQEILDIYLERELIKFKK